MSRKRLAEEGQELNNALRELGHALMREAIVPFFRSFLRVTRLDRWFRIKPKYDEM